jgi:hypothetical protein
MVGLCSWRKSIKRINVPFDVWGHILGFDSNVILRFFIRSKQIVDTSFLCNIPKIVHTDYGEIYRVNLRFGYNLCKSYELMYRKNVIVYGNKQFFSVNYNESLPFNYEFMKFIPKKSCTRTSVLYIPV